MCSQLCPADFTNFSLCTVNGKGNFSFSLTGLVLYGKYLDPFCRNTFWTLQYPPWHWGWRIKTSACQQILPRNSPAVSALVSLIQRSKKCCNLQHFGPCTLCRRIVRSRDQLLNHLKVHHQRSELTHAKVHNMNCKTYNLLPIPSPALTQVGWTALPSPSSAICRCWKAVILEMRCEVLHCQC